MRILIAGYYGFGNLGDELILGSVIAQLRSRYRGPELTVLSANPEETMEQHGVNAVSRWNPLVVALELWNNDFLILGGGGLLQNKTSSRSLLYYLGLVFLARVSQCPVVLFAMGVESIEGRLERWLTKSALTSSNVKITVRDDASKTTLTDLGVPPASIHVTADPVFARASDNSPRERYATFNNAVLLVPRFPSPPSGRRLFAIAARILRERNLKTNGLLFQPATEIGYLRSFNGEAILSEENFLSASSWEDMAAQVGHFDWIISARFHGLVLAALAGKPFIGVGDPHKVARLCRSLKMPFLSWEASEDEIKAAINKITAMAEVPNDAVENLRQAALQTANHVG